MSKVIIIRGNSGSGKTTVAKLLQQRIGCQTMLISQDMIRREMLYDKPGNLTVGLIDNLIEYGLLNCEFIIIEGILKEHRYGNMLRKYFLGKTDIYSYYYDISFEETLKRHNSKGDIGFGKNELKDWFVEHDYLGLENEKVIKDDVTKEEMIKTILKDLDLN